MMLASAQDLWEQLGFSDNMTDVQSAIQKALDAATPTIGAALTTDFDSGSFVDTYFVEAPRYAQSVQFLLQRGFVQTLDSVLICGDPTQFATDAAIDITANIVANLEKGILRDFKTGFVSGNVGAAFAASGYRNQYVQVSYTAGFPADDTLADTYAQTIVPDWLQQAAKIMAQLSIANHPVLTEAQVKLDTKLLTAQYSALISRKVRYCPVGFLPL